MICLPGVSPNYRCTNFVGSVAYHRQIRENKFATVNPTQEFLPLCICMCCCHIKRHNRMQSLTREKEFTGGKSDSGTQVEETSFFRDHFRCSQAQLEWFTRDHQVGIWLIESWTGDLSSATFASLPPEKKTYTENWLRKLLNKLARLVSFFDVFFTLFLVIPSPPSLSSTFHP